MTAEAFEALADEALKSLPEFFREKLVNVVIVVDTAPPRKRGGALLLGLYEGVPLSRRTQGYNGELPDKITLYKRSIERICGTDEEIKSQVAHTVMHEIAHHFGISDARLRELGVY